MTTPEVKTLTVNGVQVEIQGERNLLEVIRKTGIELPTFCYHSELSVYGACRLCLVEVEKRGIMAACSTPPENGMVIKTDTKQLRDIRKINIELLLANHNRECPSCVRSASCTLQTLARRLGVETIRYKQRQELEPIDKSSPSLERDPNKCVLCGDCVRVCTEVQGIGAIGFSIRGSKAKVAPAFDKNLAEVECVNCGQCAAVCPTGAISIKTNIDVVWDALADKDTIVIAQIAPAVRVAAGEEFGIPKGENVMGKLVGVLHRLGFDEVYDTAYGADLTVMEESKEFMERFNAGENLPLFTSCCPAWVKFCENRYPEFVPHLSSCRSPQQMFGAVVREYYKNPENNAGKKLVSVSIMPCTAKKEEILRPESKTNGRQDIDYVLTTTELISMIKRAGIMFDQVEIESADVPFGIGSGAGVIFGVTGGVTEAVLRKITQGHKRADMEELKSSGVRGDDGIKEIVYDYNGKEIKAAIVSGLANADQLLKKIKSGEIHYDFVEVMACRRGCVMGGGQPLDAGAHTREARMQGLYKADVNTQIKKSDENPMVQSLYEGLLKGKTHELLHRNFAEAEKEKNK